MKNTKSEDSGIKVITFKDKVQLTTNANYADDIATVLNPIKEKALTRAALETVAIVAYKQPITRQEIEDIRGVTSDYAVQVLLTHNLIEVVGRKDAIGKPLMFGTTDEFLKRFELQNLEDLPNYDDLIEEVKKINGLTPRDTIYNEFEVVSLEDEEVAAEGDAEKLENDDTSKNDIAAENDANAENDVGTIKGDKMNDAKNDDLQENAFFDVNNSNFENETQNENCKNKTSSTDVFYPESGSGYENLENKTKYDDKTSFELKEDSAVSDKYENEVFENEILQNDESVEEEEELDAVDRFLNSGF